MKKMFLFLFSILMFVQKRSCFADVYHLSRTPPTCHRRLPPVTDASHLSQTPTTRHGQPLPVTDAYLCHGHLPPVKDAYHVPRKAKSDLFFFFVAHTLGNRLPDSKEVVGDVEKGKGCILKSTKRGSRRDKYSKLKTRKRRKGVFRERRTSLSDKTSISRGQRSRMVASWLMY